MTDENSGSVGSGRSRPRREPVTLDQKPLSVTVTPSAKPDEGSPDSTPVADPAPADAAPAEETVAAVSEAPVDSAPETSGTAPLTPDDVPAEDAGRQTVIEEEASPQDNAATRQEAGYGAGNGGAEPPPPPPPPPPASAPAPRSSLGGVLIALIAGGIAGAGVSAAVPYLFGPQAQQEQRIAAIEETAAARVAQETGTLHAAVVDRVATLERQLEELARRTDDVSASPSGADNETVDALRADVTRFSDAFGLEKEEIGRQVAAVGERIGTVEQTITELDPARIKQALGEGASLNQRLTGLEETVRTKIGGIDLDRLAAAADTQAGEIARLATRVAATEGAVAETERREQAVTAALGQRVVIVTRLAVLERLASALTRGQNYTAELDTLTRLGIDATSLSPLHGAANGVAVPASLAASFSNASASFPIEELPPDAGIVERLAASASRIVRISSVDGEPSSSDVAGQVEAALRRNDTAAALAAWRNLPEQARAHTQALGETLEKRAAAETALSSLINQQIKALEALPATSGQGG
ncbi:COG4223 family protein [Pseudochelatococcus contaminans]|uniref:Mitochondrial inner membrane protein n=1 Tax=Pseudochelatococcus contaminans TaxID=1538103 RepID=A0A7W6EFF5_9HYPH|nr:hypothetical protein [Pseudochelatococcus contaminans]MBB3808819.1 hypothetical protein [Pseudochelatococcus contaminans]